MDPSAAGSPAHGEFARPGADSVIEGFASIVIVWRFTGARTLPRRRSGARIGSSATASEGKQNTLCAYLAALFIAAVAVQEGREACAAMLRALPRPPRVAHRPTTTTTAAPRRSSWAPASA